MSIKPSELTIFVIFMITYICCEIYNQTHKKSCNTSFRL